MFTILGIHAVPVVSLVKTVSYFSEISRNFTEIHITFNETVGIPQEVLLYYTHVINLPKLLYPLLQDPFMLADRIDGSVLLYTINYTDTLSGTSCGLATIPTSSCRGGVCHHVFEASSSSCPLSDYITVTVFGTSVLGNGTSSLPVSTSKPKLHSQPNVNIVTINLTAATRPCFT